MASILSVLPVQIVLQVISFIDDRSDLLSLALTCRILKQVLIPDFIDHVEIHCPPHMVEIWDSLLERPILGNCVKTLGLIHSMNEPLVVPPKFRTKGFLWKANSGEYWHDDRALSSLLKLLSKLENLTCFRAIFQTAISTDILYDLLKAIMASGCNLERLEIELRNTTYSGDGTHADNSSRGLPLIPSSLSSLPGLSLSIEHCTDTQTHAIIDTLINVPCLMQLRLRLPFSRGRLVQVLRTVFTLQWPMLKHLTIQQLNDPITSIDVEDSYIVGFLAHHTALETLYFEDILPPGCFQTRPLHSSLRSLHYVSRKVGESIPRLGDILPISVAKHLVHLSVGGVMNFELGIEENGLSSLETCVLPSLKVDSAPSFISELVKAAPNLQKCSVNIDQSCESKLISESLRLFKPLRNLTHLFGLLRRIDISELSGQQFLDAFYDNPSLTYINASSSQGKPCMRVVRQPGIRFEIIPFCFSYRTPHLRLDQWGGFFQGFRTDKTSTRRIENAY